MGDPGLPLTTGEGNTAQELRGRIEWYVQCLRDAWAGKSVRGMDEARAGYEDALAECGRTNQLVRERDEELTRLRERVRELEEAEFTATERLIAIKAVHALMSTASLPFDEIDDDALVPFSNGYSCWFVGKDQIGPGALGTARLSDYEIAERVERYLARTKPAPGTASAPLAALTEQPCESCSRLREQVNELRSHATELQSLLDAARQALETIADHSIVSERGPDEDCDWHCTAELVSLARAALGVEGRDE